MLLVILQCAFLSFSHPESTSVTVSNHLCEQSIESIYILLPMSDHLDIIPVPSSIEPELSACFSFPWGMISRIIFLSDSGSVYYYNGYKASSNPDTISISLSRKEFGGIFDRVYGTSPIMLRNGSDAVICSVLIDGKGVPEGNIMGSNPLMPGENLRIWVNSEETYSIRFFDISGQQSEVFCVSSNPDSIVEISNSMFYNNIPIREQSDISNGIVIANCISSQLIVSIEILDSSGNASCFLNIADNPLIPWERIVLNCVEQPAMVICTDSLQRVYSLSEPDSSSGVFCFNLLSLDFDFSFPERQ